MNITVDDRVSRTQYQYTLEDPDQNELNDWTSRFVDQLKKLAELEDVATDQQIAGPTLRLEINRDAASRLGVATQAIDDTLYDAFGQRKIAQFFTQQNSYWVILEVDPLHRSPPCGIVGKLLLVFQVLLCSAAGYGANSKEALVKREGVG